MQSIKYFIILMIMAGCGSLVKAPTGMVPKRTGLQTDAFGGWIIITLKDSSSVSGELIAIDNDNVIVLSSTAAPYAKSTISNAQLVMFLSSADEFTLWTSLGAVSTLSQGYIAAPVFVAWLAAGIPTAISEKNRENYVELKENNWESFVPFCRFPQGLPEGIELSVLQPRKAIGKK